MSKYTMGLCAGRHDVPVQDFIFKEILNPTDYQWMEATAERAIPSNCNELDIYVTGLTPAMLAVVKVCERRGITLTAMNFDRETGKYLEQLVFSFD